MAQQGVLNGKTVLPGDGDAAAGCFPAATAKTGTIGTDATIKTVINGSGTNFSGELITGMYLFNVGSAGLYETRRITSINNASEKLTIESQFTNDIIAGTALQVSVASYKQVDIYNFGAGDASINGKKFTLLQAHEQRGVLGYNKNVVAPFGYDFTGTSGRLHGQI